MGNFYTNYALRGVTPGSVAAALSGRSALVTPSINDVVVVFDERSDSQDVSVLSDLAAELSFTCRCPVLATLNHDDDVLWFELFAGGERVDAYDSCPGYFDGDPEADGPSGGDAAKLADAFGSTRLAEIERVLRAPADDYPFAISRHAALADALGLPGFVAGGGYGYIGEGERPAGLSVEDLIRTS